jgi:hypothetical protein
MEYPHSPDDVIDPRWNSYLHAETAEGPAALHTGQHKPDPGDLGREMRALIEPWQQGRRGTRETLEALRDLANRAL